MRIQKLHIKNGYKRFYDLTIDLGEKPKRIIALVGPNGCGKSSVFDAMLFHNNAYNPIGNMENKDYHYHSLNSDPNFNYTNIEIEFEEGGFKVVRDRLQKEGKENTIFSFRSAYRYNSDLKVKESKAVSELRLNKYGATIVSNLDQKMEENYRRLNIKYNKYLNDNDCRPSEAKEHIIGELNKSIKNCLSLEIDNLGDVEDGKGTLYFKKHDCENVFEFNVLSAGEKEVVDMLLDLYLRKDVYNDSIFIIDEPELHLNTAIQRNLLNEIDSLIDEKCQIWVATHSIGFLRALQEELTDKSQIIEFDEENKWASEVYTLYPMSKSRANWKSIFSTALDDLTSLISPKCIIYCEGQEKPGRGNIEKGFDANVFNRIFEKKYPNNLFVSSGGNTEPDQRSEIALTILSKVFTDIQIWVLKDRDVSSGKLNDENDRQVYLKNNPDNHRILKRWEIENYLFDKEVLNKFCLENNLDFNEKKYDEFVKDIYNQNLKDETGKIKNICGITTSINAEKFKLNLAESITEEMKIYKELEDVIFQRK